MKQASENGLPVMRAMPLSFPDDRFAQGFEIQFMLGDSILFAPCTNPDGNVEVYLPKGEWLSYPDNTPIEGGQIIKRKLALDEMAIYVIKGHRIPIGELVESTEDLSCDYDDCSTLPHWPS